MTMENLCHEALAWFQEQKAAICEQRGPTTLMPMFAVRFTNRSGVGQIALPDESKACFGSALKVIEREGHPEHIVYLQDSCLNGSTQDECRQGRLAEYCKNIPSGCVIAGLSGMGINALTGSQRAVLVPYGYGDDSRPCFGSQVVSLYPPTGYSAECLANWCSRIQKRRRRRGHRE